LWAWEIGVDFANDVALEAADDLAFVQAFVGSSLDVGAGGFVVSHADDGDDDLTLSCFTRPVV
jgi:hypothetical protein